SLRYFISSRLGNDGAFRPDQAVIATFARVMTKTAVGLFFHEFGRLVSIDEIRFLVAEHAKNVSPTAFAELHRRDDGLWEEVTPSGHQLERQVLAVFGVDPPNLPAWREYVPGYFEYMFIRRSNAKLLTVLKIHNSLTVLLECPWP